MAASQSCSALRMDAVEFWRSNELRVVNISLARPWVEHICSSGVSSRCTPTLRAICIRTWFPLGAPPRSGSSASTTSSQSSRMCPFACMTCVNTLLSASSRSSHNWCNSARKFASPCLCARRLPFPPLCALAPRCSSTCLLVARSMRARSLFPVTSNTWSTSLFTTTPVPLRWFPKFWNAPSAPTSTSKARPFPDTRFSSSACSATLESATPKRTSRAAHFFRITPTSSISAHSPST
mmetsp:Transcript_9512/g.17543  ORF Transcript_9512/g.17543 Transcript_9512/m.17543 type:complete len:237 (-) Transcript_9512:54-764(-)